MWVIGLLFLAACSSSPQKKIQQNEHHISQVVSHNIHMRRPLGRAADPDAHWHEQEYRGDPLPSKNFDCAPLRSLYERQDFAALRACFSSVGAVVKYRLEREGQPRLVIDDPETAPDCLKARFAEIPVPREIFFQSNEEGQMQCYASRVDNDRGWATELEIKSNKLIVPIAFGAAPENDDDLAWLIASWGLAPFVEEKKGTLFSRLVPDRLCSRCMGEEAMVKTWDTPPKMWFPKPSESK